ncbi:uncharacterized protein [Dendropsophus ebraccatus]|uniref:uncharacterized protein n=1 Tax=Dendropsophus ebraccatus TaxID=150705 RepID=UPI003831D174
MMISRSSTTPTGSSLKLTSNFTFDSSNIYELYIAGNMIGSYTDGYLMPRLNFTERLQFDREDCSFILKNLTEEDRNVYTFITIYQKNKRIQNHKEYFNVTVTSRLVTAESPRNKSSQHHEDDIYGTLAVCFLLDSVMAALMMGIFTLLPWLAKKFRNERLTCLHHVFNFVLGDAFQEATTSGFAFGEYVSLASHLVATVLFLVWSIYGPRHTVWWGICSAVSFIIQMVIKCPRCHCASLQRALSLCHPVMALWTLLTTGSIVVVYFIMCNNLVTTRRTWYPVVLAAVISLCVRAGLIGYFYWKQKNKEEKNKDNNVSVDPDSLLRPEEYPPDQN